MSLSIDGSPSIRGDVLWHDDDKKDFIRRWSKHYGYDGFLEREGGLSHEFSRMKGQSYLDHAGSGLYSERQMKAIMDDLCTHTYGNPHSASPSSLLATKVVDEMRDRVLNFFGTTSASYHLVFTQGCTASLRLVGEHLPWNKGSQLIYARNSHNSVLGMRDLVLERGGAFQSIELPLPVPHQRTNAWRTSDGDGGGDRDDDDGDDGDGDGLRLLVFPGECNFSGVKYDYKGIIKAYRDEYPNGLVMLDAAALSASAPIHLDEAEEKESPDFLAMSFYKVFGYPTGLGCLLVKTSVAPLLRKRYFGGGTVEVTLAVEDYRVFRRGFSERWEDGTISFLAIAALRHGFDQMERVNMKRMVMHTHALMQYLYNALSRLHHHDGSKVCEIYGLHHCNDPFVQGPIMSLNLRRSGGVWLGHKEVERLSAASDVHVRTGCFCNSGGCHSALQLSPDDVRAHHAAGHVCGDDQDVIDGRPTGCIRVSVGYMTMWEHANAFVRLVRDYFVECGPHGDGESTPSIIKTMMKKKQEEVEEVEASGTDTPMVVVHQIALYPLKSCGACVVSEWPVGPQGLLYDREWMLVDPKGSYLNQKKVPLLCTIHPVVDLDRGELKLQSEGHEPLVLSLHHTPVEETSLRILGTSSAGAVYRDAHIQNWFYKVLGRQCLLVRKLSHRLRSSHNRAVKPSESPACAPRNGSSISFANESQFLILSCESIDQLNERLARRETECSRVDALRFRANLLVRGGGKPHWEDDLEGIGVCIGSGKSRVVLMGAGPCSRCRMIQIDQKTAEQGKEPMLTLATYRRRKGMVLFGQHAVLLEDADPTITRIRVGDSIAPVARERDTSS